jgi:hypothetical protein
VKILVLRFQVGGVVVQLREQGLNIAIQIPEVLGRHDFA